MKFLDKSKEISLNISEIRNYTSEFNFLMARKQNSVLNKQEEKNLELLIQEINIKFEKLSKKIKEEIEEEYANIQEMKKKGEDIFSVKMYEGHLSMYAKKLKMALHEYRESQIRFDEEENKRLKNAFLIANPNATQEELDKIDTDEGKAIVESAFSLGPNTSSNILKEAQCRRVRVSHITKKISELIILIDETQKLVENSEPIADTVLDNMVEAEHHATEANSQLDSVLARTIRSRRFKRLIVGIILLIIILLILKWKFGGPEITVVNSEGSKNNKK